MRWAACRNKEWEGKEVEAAYELIHWPTWAGFTTAEMKFLAPSGAAFSALTLRAKGSELKDVLLSSTTGGQCASCQGFHHSGTGATPISRDCCRRVGPDALR